MNMWPYVHPITFLSYVRQLPKVMFVGYKHIFVGFWSLNISLFPVVFLQNYRVSGFSKNSEIIFLLKTR
jgi:hypothetical protein